MNLTDTIRRRDALLREIRAFFHARGFCEVNPPCLSRDYVIDGYIDPVEVDARQVGPDRGVDACGNSPRQFYLQTSPESAMKRLLVQGSPSIFAITPVFRRGETGNRHNPEFTMLEWYELDADIDGGIATLGELSQVLFESDGYDTLRYDEAFQRYVELDVMNCSLKQLRQRVEEIDVSLATSLAADRDAMLDVLLSQSVEPHLGKVRPLILSHYPASQSALARLDETDPRFALRFELFYQATELANGYDELRDASELERRFKVQNEIRVKRGASPLPVETTLLAAMREGLPACSGVAMGIDRVQMLLQETDQICDVLPFPIRLA